MSGEEIVFYLIQPDLLNQQTLMDLQKVISDFPSWEMARILYLKNLDILNDIRFKAELKKSILYIQDRTFLYYFIEKENTTSLFKTPLLENIDKTTEVIDAFFSQLDDKEKKALEEQHLNCFIDSNYSGAEFVTNFSESKECELKEENDLVSQFLNKENHFSLEDKVDDKELLSPNLDITEKEKESFFTETLAKIYIKQQKYGRAIDIFRKLYLKYPEKSSYFATQIDNVEQIILNEKE